MTRHVLPGTRARLRKVTKRKPRKMSAERYAYVQLVLVLMLNGKTYHQARKTARILLPGN